MKKIDLFFGENYCPKPKKIVKVIQKAVNYSLKSIHLYTGKTQENLICAIAKNNRLSSNQIILGNGIEGLINLIIRSCNKKGLKIIALSPTFNLYKKCSLAYKATFKEIEVKINEIVNLDVKKNYIKDTDIFFLAYPNNPTGSYHITYKQIENFLADYQGLLVIDECYWGVGNRTAVKLVNKYKNIVILRSFSKSLGLAGIRLGYGLSDEENIKHLEKYSKEIEEDQFSIFSCMIARSVLPFSNLLTEEYKKFKKKFILRLSRIGDIEIIPTETTFILMKHKKYDDITKIVRILSDKYGIYIKDTNIYNGFPKNILMFAVPEEEDWEYFINCLESVLNSFDT